MNESAYGDFFLHPTDSWHRRYEALRACLVEHQPLAKVARRFGVSYGTACNWVGQFRSQVDAKQRPPFLFDPLGGVRPLHPTKTTKSRTSRLPMSGRCPWSRGVAFAHA